MTRTIVLKVEFMYVTKGILNPMVTYLAFQGLIHMVHSSPLGQWFRGRERETFNFHVGFLEEMVLEDDFNFFVANRPADHANLILDGGQKVQVGTGPASKDVVVIDP